MNIKKLSGQQTPFALSVSKGIVWFDKLTTNGTGSPAIRKDDKVQIYSNPK